MENINTNFGALTWKENNEVFIKVQAKLKKCIIKLGCCAPILYNVIQCAADS